MIEFQNLSEETHHCTSFRDGDWIVWRCPHCQNYERRFNLMTSTMSIKGKNDFTHTGAFNPVAQTENVIKPLTKNLNLN